MDGIALELVSGGVKVLVQKLESIAYSNQSEQLPFPLNVPAMMASLGLMGRAPGPTLPCALESELWTRISSAWRLCSAAQMAAACAEFYSLLDILDCEELAPHREHWCKHEEAKLSSEELNVRNALMEQHRPGRLSVGVLTDSLGLHASPANAPKYPQIVQSRGINVFLSARRFATSDRYCDDLLKFPAGLDAVVLHRGVNDYAARVFLEKQRRLVSGLPVALRDTILRFVAKARSSLISNRPPRSYISKDEFLRNIIETLDLARERGVGRVIVVNIMRYPDRLLHIDPLIPLRRIDEYNNALSSIEDETCKVINMDKLNVESDYGLILSDYVHLNGAGHESLASAIVEHASR